MIYQGRSSGWIHFRQDVPLSIGISTRTMEAQVQTEVSTNDHIPAEQTDIFLCYD